MRHVFAVRAQKECVILVYIVRVHVDRLQIARRKTRFPQPYASAFLGPLALKCLASNNSTFCCSVEDFRFAKFAWLFCTLCQGLNTLWCHFMFCVFVQRCAPLTKFWFGALEVYLNMIASLDPSMITSIENGFGLVYS